MYNNRYNMVQLPYPFPLNILISTLVMQFDSFASNMKINVFSPLLNMCVCVVRKNKIGKLVSCHLLEVKMDFA